MIRFQDRGIVKHKKIKTITNLFFQTKIYGLTLQNVSVFLHVKTIN
ncbi:hypothetical protein KAOT1_09346 [Kordia algicida OT-1]|uniref:Uncharacterized protein n=1 Tax=Kordia algicida OT-1 TaxID=391587 RepID=A9E3T3_9FLAO|nr:hypothetical protein KAOT1_09346 [Kordia algicida OT-1]